MTGYVLTHPWHGVYLGEEGSLLYWSALAPTGRSSAVLFTTKAAAEAMIPYVSPDPAQVTCVSILSDTPGQASRLACLAAGLPVWSDRPTLLQ